MIISKALVRGESEIFNCEQYHIKRDALQTEAGITREHVKNNQDVRKLLVNRDIKPEELPPAEDIKKLERKLTSEEKKLPGAG